VLSDAGMGYGRVPRIIPIAMVQTYYDDEAEKEKLSYSQVVQAAVAWRGVRDGRARCNCDSATCLSTGIADSSCDHCAKH
jgi:hypothetical protein